MTEDSDRIVQEIRVFASKLKSDILTDSSFEVCVEAGYKFRIGQQFKVVILAQSNFRDVLLHAYVPDEGYPVVLGFMGTRGIAENDAQLLQHLYVTLPNNRDIQARIRAHRALHGG